MRSVKRVSKPVHRYKSLLFPGMAVLAVLAFYAAFVSPKPQRGETVEFEQDGLRLEITGVHNVEDSLANFNPELKIYEPFDTYYIYPGAAVKVLEAPPMEDGAARWELETQRRGLLESEPLELLNGMDPLEFPEEGTFHIYDLGRKLTVVRFWVTDSDGEYWK